MCAIFKFQESWLHMSETTETNELIKVDVTAPTFQESDTFLKLKEDIPLVIARAHQILDQVDEDNIDLDQLETVIKDMKEVKPYYNQVEKARKDVQRYLKANVKEQMELLDSQLDSIGFNELDGLIAQASDYRRIKQDTIKENRWEQLHQQFNQTLDQYPLLAQYIPAQLDFDKFKALQPKLVSAAKTREIGHKEFNAVSEYIGNLESDVQTILSFQSAFQDQLFNQYQLSPNLPQIVQLNRQLEQKEQARLAKEKAEMERKIKEESARQAKIQAQKILEEEHRKAKIAQDKAIAEAQAEAKKNADNKNNSNPQVIIKTVQQKSINKSDLDISDASRASAGSPFSETLESYLKTKYPKITDDASKFDAIFKTVLAIGKQDPEIMRFVKSPKQGLDAITLLLTRNVK